MTTKNRGSDWGNECEVSDNSRTDNASLGPDIARFSIHKALLSRAVLFHILRLGLRYIF